jgi:6,7-dimethyl-8-ribityllumazine synthase
VTHLDDDARVGPLRVVIAVSRYNGWITDRLRDGALEAIERLEPGSEAVVAPASGSLELPTIAGEAAMSGDFDAVVALGCVIKGETEHDRHISQAIIGTLTQTSVSSGVPIGIGVLTVNDAAQAEARAGGTLGNKGAEAMEAAIASVRVLRGLRAYSEGAVAGGEKAP